ncbi:PssE/Cps14G family polysaccharide biosynthesis glycosyltransferase [Vibrio rumoiensis]|uniref:PssE/Cps14G family polysaccharide biosynthesis glycosyltransferase n=1 Tax=Vibrio rumoiensis TaxID=76258 RepID=UPI003749319A
MQEDYKLLLTLGTTEFSELVNAVIKFSCDSGISTIIQTPNASQFVSASINTNIKVFEYLDNIDCLYKKIPYIITHAGAGSCYRLLELNKKILVVPNLSRIDKHQSDIGNWIKNNDYALYCDNLNNIDIDINKLINGDLNFKKYKKYDFFKVKEILGLF